MQTAARQRLDEAKKRARRPSPARSFHTFGLALFCVGAAPCSSVVIVGADKEVLLTHEEGELAVGRQWVMGPAQAQEFQKEMGGIVALRN